MKGLRLEPNKGLSTFCLVLILLGCVLFWALSGWHRGLSDEPCCFVSIIWLPAILPGSLRKPDVLPDSLMRFLRYRLLIWGRLARGKSGWISEKDYSPLVKVVLVKI